MSCPGHNVTSKIAYLKSCINYEPTTLRFNLFVRSDMAVKVVMMLTLVLVLLTPGTARPDSVEKRDQSRPTGEQVEMKREAAPAEAAQAEADQAVSTKNAAEAEAARDDVRTKNHTFRLCRYF